MMQAIKSNPSPLLSYLVWFCGAFFFFIDYVLRVAPSILTPTLMHFFHANAFAIGGFSACFYYAYIGMQIPVGILVDRFGPKRLLIVASLVCALSTLVFAQMETLIQGFISRFFLGFGASFAFVGTLKLISLWFAPERFAFLAGLTQAMGMVGAMVGQGPMGAVYHSLGWRSCLSLFALVFFLLSILMAYLIKEQNSPQLRVERSKPKQSIRSQLFYLLRDKQNLLNCLVIGLLFGPTACFGEQWGASFLSLNLGTSIEQAGQATGMMFIGMAIGCPIMGFISDRLQRRVIVIRFCILACFLLLGLVIFGKAIPGMDALGPMTYTLILFCYGFFNSGIVPSYALASEINRLELTGLALGLANMASVIIGALMIPIVGFILDHCWTGAMQDGMPLFELRSYQIAFSPLFLGLVIACISSFFQEETYCKRKS